MKYNTVIIRFLTLLLAALIASSCVRGPSRVRVSAILVATEAEAQQIVEKLRVGGDFAQLARLHSIGPGKDEGGDLGYFAPGEMMSEWEAEVLSLRVGQYSGVIYTASGYFILMKADEKTSAEYARMKEKEGQWIALAKQTVELIQQGRYEEGVPIAKKALQVAEATFGLQDPHTAASLNNLAELYRVQGKHNEAEPLYQRALKINEKALGPDHPEVATSLNNLAELYRVQGKHNEAGPLLKRALEINEKVLGPDHPAVATSLNNLAEFYRGQGKYAEAEPLYKRSLAILEKRLGPDHPKVATVLENMAELYEDMGNVEETMKLNKRAEKIRSKNR